MDEVVVFRGNGACVEVMSPLRDVLAVRDSKTPTGPLLGFPVGSWAAFLGTVDREDFTGV